MVEGGTRRRFVRLFVCQAKRLVTGRDGGHAWQLAFGPEPLPWAVRGEAKQLIR
jgi:hypothetical protein